IWFRKLKSTCGSVVHTGDNLTGEGDGDDEVINVYLGQLPVKVEYLAFTVNSFRGQSFNDVDNAFCRVV
ncbi:TerD family protein, partial [Raoultella planticola]|nr:TerD family protein [Raoultella planticola]